MAKKMVQRPECNGRGQIPHRDSVREIFYGDRRLIYKRYVRCQGPWLNLRSESSRGRTLGFLFALPKVIALRVYGSVAP